MRKSSLAAACLLFSSMAVAQEPVTNEVPRFVNYRHGFNKDTLALQICLDRQNLSCNCVDGVWGTRTEIALMTWQTLNGKEPTGEPTAEILSALGGDTELFMSYTIVPDDLNKLVCIPNNWDEKSKLPAMGYQSVQEMLAEKGHTSMRCVERLNPSLASLPNPPAGTTVILPDCTCTKPKSKMKADCLRISLSRTEITAFDAAGTLIALFPCSIARDKANRPAGEELTVKNAAMNPTYLYDPQLFRPGCPETAKLVIPAGPNNPVGIAWIGLSKQGYGMHGTPSPETIGNAESHGCFRLANWNAVKLLGMIKIGTPMLIEE